MRSLSNLGSLFVVAVVAAAAATAGCSPVSQYRYTGMVPAAKPIPFDGRTAERGTGRLEGSVTGQVVQETAFPELHDTALHVPEVTVEGAAAYAVNDHVELGLRFSFARYGQTQQTASGTPPLPDQPSMVGVGPEMRSTISLDHEDKWALGIAWNLMRYTMPTAAWSRTQSCTAGPKCFVDGSTTGGATTYYSLASSGSQDAWLLSLSVLLSHAFGPRGAYGHLFGGFAFHPTFGNDGFTDSTSSSGEITTKGWAPIVTAGYGIRLSPVRLGASVFLPLGGDAQSIQWGMGGQITVGIELGGPSKARQESDAAKASAMF